MKLTSRSSLERKLGFGVSAGLAVFAVVAMLVTSVFAYRYQLQASRVLQEQLVAVVRAQAEVAAFAENADIANGVIDGLLANPLLLAVRLRSHRGFEASGGQIAALSGANVVASYPLHSPSDPAASIGQLDIVMNADQVAVAAMTTTAMLLAAITLQVLLAAVLIVSVSRRVIIRPIVELTSRLAEIEPGRGIRIAIDEKHQDDEIGLLSHSANALIDAHEHALAELRALATIDSLTGTCNRREFIRRLEEELVRIQRLELGRATVLMIDIDHFKKINDTHGHPAGDAALMQLGTILRSNARRIDTVGRLGGEEFAILLVSTDIDEGTSFAERLRQTVAETPVVYEGRLIQMTLSIGIAALSLDDCDSTVALARADKALYLAKDQGRNCVVVASS